MNNISSTVTSSFPKKTSADKSSLSGASQIQVDAGITLESSQKISNFLGIQGVPHTFNRSKVDQWGVQAWRELGLNICEVCLFSDDDGSMFGDNYSISVLRNAQGKLELDFTNFETQLNYLTQTLGIKQINFAISHMPKAISSNPNSVYYMFHTPANYEEWDEIVYRAILHLKNKLGFSGAHYQVWSEPDSYCCFRGRPERNDKAFGLLDDYIELYASSWRAVKRADPTAKVGGPMSGVYSSEICRSFGHPWGGVDDYIQKIASYNREHLTMQVTLDEVIWQDYDWFNDGRIADGVKHIRSVLKANGFSADIPQYLVGWNTDYGSPPETNPVGSKTLPQHAAYIVTMIVEQLNLGEKGLNRAYLWPFDYDYQFPNIALVTIPYPEQKLGGEEGSPERAFYGDQIFPAVTQYCKRPAYAGLQMLVAMKNGQFIKVTSDKLPKGVQVMATRDNDRVIFLATNNSNSTHQVIINFSQLPFDTGSVMSSLKRVDGNHSMDGQGLEVGSKNSVEVKDGKLTLPLEMSPYSVVQICLER